MILPIRLVEKPWGVEHLPAPFITPTGKRIGEIWFEPPPALPQLLAKYILTSEKLSVQVHPTDAQTLVQGLGRQGKEECWLVIAAEPGARLGIGFRHKVGADTMRRAALDGSIEAMMVWHDVAPGDFYYIPANTVHAIGAGVSLIEVQQNSDITYRLYDYGRPRELHLDAAVAVARGEVYDKARWHRRLADGENAALVDGPCFRLDRVYGPPDAALSGRYGAGAALVLPLSGGIAVGDAVVAAGECTVAAVGELRCDADAQWLVAQPVTR